MAVIKPFADRFETLPGDSVPFRVRIRAPREDLDWSLDNGFPRNGRTEQQAWEYRHRLNDALREDEIRTGYIAQGHHMSGVVADTAACTISMLSYSSEVRLWRASVPCDGILLPRGAGFVLSPGGCGVVVLTALTKGCEPVFIAAHAGLKSLVNTDGKRQHESVIDAMVAAAKAQHAVKETMTLRAFYPLPWQGLERWSKHPQYGEANTALLNRLLELHHEGAIRIHEGVEYIDLALLIQEQARRAGIKAKAVDTGSHVLPEEGPYAYTSHPEPSLAGLKRNLVTVLRLS